MTDPGMTPTRLQQVKALFEVAVDLPSAGRTALLERIGTDDAPLAEELRTLLAAHDRAGDTLQQSDSESLLRAVARADDPWLGLRIGSYDLVRRIGMGGMGAVYEGVRADDQFRKRVAIKFLRRSVESDLAIRRFRYERQILANLNHKNIAALLDGGVTADGQPYFVMEYVDGQPITRWCNARQLGVEDRVALFRQVCAAVQHAHQNLVVHRDLKPGNILVADDGTVKLLDFGIAKLLREEEGSDQLPPTQGNQRAFTPEYASPEQVRGLPVSTGSDVYALGVILFELLTGRRPFRLEGRLIAEIEATVCEEPPPVPSSVIDGNFAQKTGERTTARLRRRVTGDLDAIVLTALRKDADRRYGSADQLGMDLRCFLEGLPVTARRDGLTYRFGKLLRRRKVELAAATLAVLSLLGGIVATTRQAGRAEAASVRAAEINQFLVTMLGAADPGSFGREVTMREVLDSAAVRADSLRSQPALDAEVRSVIGSTYLGLGELQAARVQLAKVVAAREQLTPDGSRELASSIGNLGLALEQLGELSAADSLQHLGRAMLQQLDRPADPLHGVFLDNLARLRQKLGDLPAAESLQRQALAFRQRVVPDDDVALANSLNNLGVVVGQLGRSQEAELLHLEAVAATRRAHGNEHPTVAAALAQLAVAYEMGGQESRADSTYRIVLDMRRRLLGASHPDYAWTLFNHAQFLLATRRWPEAAARAREVLQLRGKSLPDGHPAVATAMQALGVALDNLDSLEQGGSWLEQSLKLRRETLPEGHWLIASGESVLGEHLARLGKFAEAERVLLSSEAVLNTQRGDQSPQVRDARRRLVDLYLAWRRPVDAARWQASLKVPERT
jgi:serine/threonine-protein kinase